MESSQFTVRIRLEGKEDFMRFISDNRQALEKIAAEPNLRAILNRFLSGELKLLQSNIRTTSRTDIILTIKISEAFRDFVAAPRTFNP